MKKAMIVILSLLALSCFASCEQAENVIWLDKGSFERFDAILEEFWAPDDGESLSVEDSMNSRRIELISDTWTGPDTGNVYTEIKYEFSEDAGSHFERFRIVYKTADGDDYEVTGVMRSTDIESRSLIELDAVINGKVVVAILEDPSVMSDESLL